MEDITFNLKGGVLIIGSLLWQDYLNVMGDDIRKTWRAEHLSVEKKIMVNIPIRYGRFSNKSNIYTMTFSKQLSKNKLGTGYFVPFRKPNITTKMELLEEAKALSNAEGMLGGFAVSWSALGIIFNSKRINERLRTELTDFWKCKVFEKTDFNHKQYRGIDRETPCLKENGLLNFSWFKPLDSRHEELLNTFDFMIATVTLPTPYPTLKELSENVRADNSRFYFIENYKNGITTYQDIAIINYLNHS